MDREVSRALAELEHKLHELERALASAGRGEWGEQAMASSGEEATQAGAPAAEQRGGARLVDEGLAAEPHARPAPAPHHPAPDVPPMSAREPLPPGGARFAPPLAAGARPVPPEAPPTAIDVPPITQAAPNPEQVRASYGESIELAELVRFRDRLDRTLRELAEDYERIIRLGNASSPSSSRSDER